MIHCRPRLKLVVDSQRVPLSRSLSSLNLERIADELLSLNKMERHDYSILLRHKMGGSAVSGVRSIGASSGSSKAEKTAIDVKLEKFNTAAKIKVVKEVRAFTDLGMKEAKGLVREVPAVLRKGASKEELKEELDASLIPYPSAILMPFRKHVRRRKGSWFYCFCLSY